MGERRTDKRSGSARPPTGKISAPSVKGLDRERLTGLLPLLLERRLGLIVAPAGSGKTTLLAQMARRATSARVPVAWFRAESSDGEEERFIAGIEGAFAEALPAMPRGAATLEDVARSLDAWHGDRILLVIDDFHAVDGSPVGAAVEHLIESAPPRLSVLIASRSMPAINVPRFRLADSLLEVGPDALRFRSWEVEQLYKDVYGDPLSPEDLAELAGRTEGWAAGLQLFHLATKGMSPGERRGMLARLHRGSRLVREYLARNLVETLPEDVRGFLIETSVLGRLDAATCDALLDRTGSKEILEELTRRQICTPEPFGDDATYRYHEVFRLHLEALLVEQAGEARAKALFSKAGALLERAGALPEALRAFSRAEDSEAVQRLLGRRGRQLADHHGNWIESLPSAMPRQDPWLLLASARTQRARGRVTSALDAYRQAERDFVGSNAAELCLRERRSLAAWLDPAVAKPVDWSGVLRRATAENPMQIRDEAEVLPDPYRSFVGGAAALLYGDTTTAQKLFAEVSHAGSASAELDMGARVCAVAARILGGEPATNDAHEVADHAERLGLTWMARVARALVAEQDVNFEDPWGSVIADFFAGWSHMSSGTDARDSLRDAADRARKLGARVLEAWATAALALATTRAGDAEGRKIAVRAERDARSLGVRGAQGLAALALSETGSRHAELVATIEHACGLSFPRRISEPPPAPPAMIVRCFGGFSIERDGIPIDLSGVRPQARRALRLLAIQGGRPVHREVLINALWSEMDPEAATRNLQVAISSLRAALDRDVRRPDASMIVRDGETYRLALPPGGTFDLVLFDEVLARARKAKASGAIDETIAACEQALELFDTGLLPEDGPAEWVLDERARREADAVEAAHTAARLYLDRGEAAAAVRMCERLISIDRYRDGGWRLAINAYKAAGDLAAAARARARYAQMLHDLDVADDELSDSPP